MQRPALTGGVAAAVAVGGLALAGRMVRRK